MARGNQLEIEYSPNPKLTIKSSVSDTGEMFQVLGPLQELFSSCRCGKCGGTSIRYVHRLADGNDVYELQCEAINNGRRCGRKLHLGKDQATENLFPRRYPIVKIDGKWTPKTDADGKKVFWKNNGWVIWDKTLGDKGDYSDE